MSRSIMPGSITVIEPTGFFQPTNRSPANVVEALEKAVVRQSGRAKKSPPPAEFYSWLRKMKLGIEGIFLYGGEYHREEAGKLQIMLAFADRGSYTRYLQMNLATPTITDTCPCAYLLGIDGASQKLREPPSYYDANFGGEILILHDSGSRLAGLLRERQHVFASHPDLAKHQLFELFTHKVFVEYCRQEGYLDHKNPLFKVINPVLIRGASEKLEFLGELTCAEDIAELAGRSMHNMRVKRDTARNLIRKMARGLKRKDIKSSNPPRIPISQRRVR